MDRAKKQNLQEQKRDGRINKCREAGKGREKPEDKSRLHLTPVFLLDGQTKRYSWQKKRRNKTVPP